MAGFRFPDAFSSNNLQDTDEDAAMFAESVRVTSVAEPPKIAAGKDAN